MIEFVVLIQHNQFEKSIINKWGCMTSRLIRGLETNEDPLTLVIYHSIRISKPTSRTLLYRNIFILLLLLLYLLFCKMIKNPIEQYALCMLFMVNRDRLRVVVRSTFAFEMEYRPCDIAIKPKRIYVFTSWLYFKGRLTNLCTDREL